MQRTVFAMIVLSEKSMLQLMDSLVTVAVDTGARLWSCEPGHARYACRLERMKHVDVDAAGGTIGHG